ncbi:MULTISPECIES: hypothetical protein [Streptomyces]|uniref:Uncharacterized protein n=1 Tax=Streptomyces plumbiresistens TaxID=511811 RepID=A0ABP7R0Y4_9ACTN|nr:hypothetical protein [Streptomyces sp. NBC_01373]MCX4699351.1 hypothetical protein [Streptomyces sp. NBC_01373]
MTQVTGRVSPKRASRTRMTPTACAKKENQAIAASVGADLEVVGEAGAATDALVRFPATRPDVVERPRPGKPLPAHPVIESDCL